LDGDLYFVSWEPTLMPNQVEFPMDYTAPASKEENGITINSVIDFFVKFIETDQLGRIANAHVAISDQSKDGVKDPQCIKLAELFSLAVDFPKHGSLVTIPPEIKSIKYPDFMGKTRLECYESQKIIGKMYRKCKSVFADEFLTRNSTIQINESLLINGFKDFLPDAEKLYSTYRREIERIMGYVGCKYESELFVGTFLSSTHSDEAKNVHKISTILIKHLWQSMRKKFGKNSKENALKKASAWYYACYKNKENEKLRILSFPWIVEDIIYGLKFKNCDFFERSIIKKFNAIQNDFQLWSRFVEKIELKYDLEKIIDSPLIMCGDFGLFLFENTKEIKLFSIDPNFKIDENLQDAIEEYYDNISMIKNRTLTCDQSDYVSFNLSSSLNTILRYLYIRSMIFKNPIILPVLYTILHMARLDDLFSKLSEANIVFDIYIEFCMNYFLCENYLVEHLDQNQVKKQVEDEFMSFSRNRNLIDSIDE
jgi:hypothetical protein